MTTKKQNRIATDPGDISKKYLIKEESEDVRLDGDLMEKVERIMRELTKTLNRFPKAKPIGWAFGLAFEENHIDRFNYFSLALANLEEANEKAADLLGKDIINRMKLSYGREKDAIRQDLKGENQ